MRKRLSYVLGLLVFILVSLNLVRLDVSAEQYYGEKPYMISADDVDYDELSEVTGLSKDVCKTIISGTSKMLKGEESSVSLAGKGVTTDQMSAAREEIWNTMAKVEPYICSATSCGYRTWSSGGVVTKLELYDYNGFSSDEVKTRAANIQAVVEEIFRVMPKGMNDADKALWLNNYLVLNAAYDYDNYLNGSIPRDSYEAYGILVNNTGVCDGYSKAYLLLLNLCGIDAIRVTGTGNGGGHAWNEVKIDGNWYSFDVTWNDPVPDVEGRVYYNYLFLTDAQMGKNHVLESKGMGCTDTKFADWFGRNATGLTYYDGYWYYLQNGAPYRSDIYGNNKEEFKTPSPAFVMNNGYLFYESNEWDIYVENMNTGEAKKIGTIDSDGIGCYNTSLFGSYSNIKAYIDTLSLVGNKLLVFVNDPYKVTDSSYAYKTVIKTIELDDKYFELLTEPEEVVIPDGLNEMEDGTLAYYTDNKIDTEYNGMVYREEDDKFWIVKNGYVDKTFSGMEYSPYDGNFYAIKNGYVDFSYDELLYSPYDGNFWACRGGRVIFDYDGLSYSSYDGNFWACKEGKVDFGYDGLIYSPYDGNFWACRDGKVDFGYDGLSYSSYDGNFWACKEGRVIFDYDGLSYSPYDGNFWACKEGKVVFDYDGVIYSPYDGNFWACKEGKVIFGYEGIMYSPYDDNLWLVQDGKINFDFSGSYNYEGTDYNINNGCVIK